MGLPKYNPTAAKKSERLETLLCLTYGHFIIGFWLRLLQEKVPYQCAGVIMPKVKDLDFVFGVVFIVSNEYIILSRTSICWCAKWKFQDVQIVTYHGRLSIFEPFQCLLDHFEVWSPLNDFTF